MKTHKNHLRLLILLLLVLLACVGYMTVGVHFENQKLFAYAMRIRTPKLIAMLITAFAIGSASIVFQSIINNTIVTPCLLGMAGGGVSKNIWNCFRTTPAGTGQPLTCSTSGMGLRLK